MVLDDKQLATYAWKTKVWHKDNPGFVQFWTKRGIPRAFLDEHAAMGHFFAQLWRTPDRDEIGLFYLRQPHGHIEIVGTYNIASEQQRQFLWDTFKKQQGEHMKTVTFESKPMAL